MNQRPILGLVLMFCLTGTAACTHLGDSTAARQTFDPIACHAGTFDIYFPPDQVKLSAQAKAQIEDAQRALSGCKIVQVSVVGLPDRADDMRAAKSISQARADSIVATLKSSGWPGDKFQVRDLGDKTAGNDGQNILQRRARITVQAAAS
jgi:outer membrane protein OmpA-like peptidoglycan-associated protein